MIQAVSLSRLDKYSFFSAVPQSWSFFYANHPRLCFCAETRMILFYAASGGPWTGWGWAVEYFFNFGGFCLLSVSRASVSEDQVDKNQTSALVLLLNVLIHENENNLFFSCFHHCGLVATDFVRHF